MRKFFVAYRNNDLYATYVPRLLEGLNVVGTFVVPRGTELETVREAATAAVEKAVAAGATGIISDETCGHIADVPVPGDYWPRCRFGCHVTLDRLFAWQIENICPNNTIAENFAWFAKQVVGDRRVTSVVVAEDRIADHDLVGTDDDRQPFQNGARLEWMVRQLNQLFPNVAVKKVFKLQEALEFATDPEALLVLDRHCGIKEIMDQKAGWYNSLANWPYPSMLMLLPLETCAANLASAGTIDFEFDLEAMRNEISNR